jgi:hypothetical protein
MIGPQNRKPAYSVETEEAILSTSPVMASWADPTVPHTCGDCALWDEIKRGGRKGQGRWRKYRQRMGRPGAPVDRRQQACKLFDATTRENAPE